jgi:hypothetical protein
MKRRICYILLVFIVLGTLVALRPSKNLNAVSKKSDNQITEIKIRPKTFMLLPPVVNENSGLVYDCGLIWTFNDSGGLNILYGINRNGKIQTEVTIANAKNVDWEDIAHDDKYFYIADAGNNRGNRRDLVIYKVEKKGLTTEGSETTEASVISFTFEDQTNFLTEAHAHSFDCEALITYGDSLYLFTKDWVNGYTVVYSLPKESGDYIAKRRNKFNARGLITGADISADGKHLVLCGYSQFKPFAWIFSHFEPGNFFTGKIYYLDMSELFMAQIEGVTFLTNDSILISCERTPIIPEQIFLLPPDINN